MKLLHFVLTKVSFVLNREFKPGGREEVAIGPEISLNHEVREKEKQLVVMLGVRQITGDIPYYFEVEAGSIFQFDEIPEEKILKQFETINCPAIIFPYIRESIADLTRRAGFPPLHLDPINFIELAKKRESNGQQKVKDDAEKPQSISSQSLQ
jgi:preprotein translocase subunit SecB